MSVKVEFRWRLSDWGQYEILSFPGIAVVVAQDPGTDRQKADQLDAEDKSMDRVLPIESSGILPGLSVRALT